MSYINLYLNDIEKLQNEFNQNPEVVKYYIKYEGFTGSSESITYVNDKINEYLIKKSKK
jgi:hypothetical protein